MSDRAPRITTLSDVVVDQIAAGEVVERPASIVKELLENSVDAGGRAVSIVVEAGGERLIRVSDDGHGIVEQDIALALTRHCTSKLRSAEDLRSLSSLGFRGEALPSIASVARVSLISRTVDADYGTELVVDGGARIHGPAPVGHPPGTTVEVRDLFFNVPGRKQFLKSARTEFHHIMTLVRCLAAGRFDIALKLQHNGRNVLQLDVAKSASAIQRRLAKLCGKRFADAAIPVEQVEGGVSIWGWLGDPQTAGRQSDVQFVLVNGRAVRDPYISRAVRRAYGELLGEERQPQYLLQLELAPDRVDINVHPAKQEVRFREPRVVHDFVFSALRGLLRANVGAFSPQPLPTARDSHKTWEPRDRVGYVSTVGRPAARTSNHSANNIITSEFGHVVALVGQGFVVIVDREQHGFLMNMQAARQAVLHAGLLRGYARQTLKPVPLLVPESFDIAGQQAECIERHQALLARCGIVLDLIGSGRALLRALPAQVERDCDYMAIASAVVAGLAQSDETHAGVFIRIAETAAKIPVDLDVGGSERMFVALQKSATRVEIDLAGYMCSLDGERAARLFE